ncbi:MAG: hypothetical protein JW745_03535 [Sedimentisphaerales bacterium]|nr:hypothetical protein [Sedimentisphaerales bacterium]MBN2844210.1 hypothetical protein [Sedimentisphaerales bacterium]
MKIKVLLTGLLFSVFLFPAIVCSQETEKPAVNSESTVRASCYYPDLEPKQLFQMLSETYHVQFDGIDLVSGPITLISREKVDVSGMMVLLNEVLQKQNRKAIANGQIISIIQIQDIDQVIKLNHLKPDQAVEILKKRFMTTGTEGEKNQKPSLIEPHPNGDSIIVRGPEKVIKEIQSYLSEIDIPLGQPVKTRTAEQTPLPGSDVSSLLQANMPEIVIRSVDVNNAVTDEMITYLREVYLAAPNATAEERARKVYKITKHPKQRKIVIEGPDFVIDDMEKVIKEELDLTPAGPPVIQKYITLNYISAEAFQNLMANNPNLKDKYIAIEEQNNILTVETQDETIFQIIDELKNKFDIDQKELRFIPLAYANAKDITNLLNQIYREAKQEVPAEQQEENVKAGNADLSTDKIKDTLSRSGLVDESLLGRISKSLALVSESEYTIVADEIRNALIVYTFSRNFPKIMQMVGQLDVAEKMVYIEVFITQVNKSKLNESGVQFNYANGDYTVGSAFDGFGSIPGLSYEVLDEDFKLSLKAMVTDGNIDVVSRPHLVTKNNIEGEISLGNKVPILKSIETRYEQAYMSKVEYEDIGTRLKVKPQIHPDNYVSLEILQSVDDISTETFQISESYKPQIINKREAKVNLRIKNGQTVCLAGFTGDRINEVEEKVPFLGDIPLLGLLFKHTSKKREKIEMIIFLTPHILQEPEEFLNMTNDQRTRSNSEMREGRDMEPLKQQDTPSELRYSIKPEITLSPEPEPAEEEEQLNADAVKR